MTHATNNNMFSKIRNVVATNNPLSSSHKVASTNNFLSRTYNQITKKDSTLFQSSDNIVLKDKSTIIKDNFGVDHNKIETKSIIRFFKTLNSFMLTKNYDQRMPLNSDDKEMFNAIKSLADNRGVNMAVTKSLSLVIVAHVIALAVALGDKKLYNDSGKVSSQRLAAYLNMLITLDQVNIQSILLYAEDMYFDNKSNNLILSEKSGLFGSSSEKYKINVDPVKCKLEKKDVNFNQIEDLILKNFNTTILMDIPDNFRSGDVLDILAQFTRDESSDNKTSLINQLVDSRGKNKHVGKSSPQTTYLNKISETNNIHIENTDNSANTAENVTGVKTIYQSLSGWRIDWVNSAPSVSNKVSRQLFPFIKEEVADIATSAWNCIYNRKETEALNSGQKEAKVHRVGSFGVTKDEAEDVSVKRAMAYINNEIIKEDDNSKDSWILDSRLLDGNHEKKVFERHLKILTIAVHRINEERVKNGIVGRVKLICTHIPTTKKGFRAGTSVYDPIHPLGHKNLTPFKPREYSFNSLAYASQPNLNAGFGGAEYDPHPIKTATISERIPMLEDLKKSLREEIFENKVIDNGQQKYMLLCVIDKAIELLSKSSLNFGEGLLYDTLLTILAKYIPNNYHVLLGCVSAKDRTTMEVALMNALMPLIEDIISEKNSDNLNKFFNNITPYNQINVKFLTPEQIAKFIDNYDDKDNLYFSNRMSTGITTNINPFEMLKWIKPLLYHPKFTIYGKDHPGA